ncbi:acetoacetate decarboxylase family protein [Halomarina litorea]|uniref:acetoacetate decarboxylase family protein n=1 Tax=Halomarina litorea TaxID=2961595 RepID=UPI0020C2C2BA|nr:acetoacetate decarboxylase family protein [Halomarina sp. BCD28]
MTGFVRTAAEVAEIRDRMAENRFLDARSVSVRYLTRPGVVEAVLPPGLEPTDDPVVEAEVVVVGESNCVGSFAGGGLYVQARHGDVVGQYCLAMPMSTDAAVRWGRDLFGEPKKRAAVRLEREGPTVAGSVARHGEDLLTVEATLERERDVDPATRTVFHYKALPDVTGRGFQFDPVLVRVDFESDLHRFETGPGSVTLGRTAHDPWADLAVEEVRGAAYVEADLASNQTELATVDPEAFAPYGLARGADDWLSPDTLPADAASSGRTMDRM